MSRILVKIGAIPSVRYFVEDPSDDVLSRLGLVDTQLGHSTGFYDWLRTDRRDLIGIRYWPFEETEFLLRHLPNERLQYDARGALLIFLSDETSFDEASSDDQAFEDCRVLLQGDEYFVLFGCSNLTVEEKRRLKGFDIAQQEARS